MEQKNYITYKDKYNKKYGYTKGKSHTLEQVSKDTGVSMKGLQQIYNKGIGAYKTNPQSVRPNVKSKEQWAMARVYSAVMGGKASNIDSNELKMETGGITRKFAEGGQITQYEIQAMREYINGANPNPKLKSTFEQILRKYGVDLERGDLRAFPKGRYVDPYNFEGYEYMRNQNEEAGVYFLLTGEYQLVSKAIYEKDYAMWLFYNYLGRINISFASCREWLNEAVDYFSYTLPVPINLIHTPNAKDGRSFAQWYAVNDDYKITAEGKINRRMTFQFNNRWYYNEIGLVGNGDYKGGGWGTMYKEKKTGLLVPEYTETSFHFNTLIHEFAHCLDFQTQLVQNIEKYESEKSSGSKKKFEFTEIEQALYGNKVKDKELVVSNVIGTHFDTFVDSLIRILRACSSGKIPLTQLFEQQALNVQTALSGTYGDLILAQRERKAKERAEMQLADELRDNKRFTWQSSWNRDMKAYLYENAIQNGLKANLDNPKEPYTLSEIIELDNLLTTYMETEFYRFESKNPSKAQERINVVRLMKEEANRILNNHYDNVKKQYAYGFVPKNELDNYLANNCNINDYRDYKSWKECSKQVFKDFQ